MSINENSSFILREDLLLFDYIKYLESILVKKEIIQNLFGDNAYLFTYKEYKDSSISIDDISMRSQNALYGYNQYRISLLARLFRVSTDDIFDTLLCLLSSIKESYSITQGNNYIDYIVKREQTDYFIIKSTFNVAFKQK